jgi:hypothetical protein
LWLELEDVVTNLEPNQVHRQEPKTLHCRHCLLCAQLNIRSEEALRQSPAAGAVWETFVFAQLRGRERRAGRTGSPFFWHDRTREVDFVVDAGGVVSRTPNSFPFPNGFRALPVTELG